MHKFLITLLLLLFTAATLVTGQSSEAPPDPYRFEQQISSFEQWDSKNSAPGNAILFAGSSSIVGWKTAEAFPGYPVINRGFGGSHISDQIYFYDKVIGRFDPSLMVFYCGENDVHAGVPLEQVFSNYVQLVQRILDDFPDVHFLYITIKSSSSRLAHSDNFSVFNQMVQEFNQADERLHYIDLATALTGNGALPDDAFFVSDRLHLNDRGYEAWNERLAPVLEEMETKGIIQAKR